MLPRVKRAVCQSCVTLTAIDQRMRGRDRFVVVDDLLAAALCSTSSQGDSHQPDRIRGRHPDRIMVPRENCRIVAIMWGACVRVAARRFSAWEGHGTCCKRGRGGMASTFPRYPMKKIQ